MSAAEGVFRVTDEERAMLCRADKRMAELVGRIGPIERALEGDLFTALVNSIVGQQISTAAHRTVFARLVQRAGEITPQRLCVLGAQEIQRCGLSHRKAGYIAGTAEMVQRGEIDLDALQQLPDDEVCRQLSALRGVGVWTAEMLMLFSLGRRNVFSFGDLGIRRGLMMLHHHREMPRQRFERYRRRYSPCCSAASLYLWALAGGELSSPAEGKAAPTG